MNPLLSPPTPSRPGSMVEQGRAVLAISLAPLFWAGNFVVADAVSGVIPPVSLAFWRWLIALAVLLPISGPALWHYRSLLLQHRVLILALAATELAGFSVLSYQALTLTSAINAVLFFAAAPVLVPPIARILIHAPLSLGTLLRPVISLVGAGLIILQGDPGNLLALRFNPGDLVMLVAIPLWSLYTVLLKRCPPELPQVVLLSASISAAVVLLLPLYLLMLATGERVVLSREATLGLFYIALGASVGGFFCWSYGVRILGPNRAGNFLHLVPVFGAMLAIVFLGETLALYHLIGAGIVWLGLVLTPRP